MSVEYLLVLENGDTFQLENGDDFQLDFGDTANALSLWKGAVQPAEVGASGNEIQLWKGAVQPAASVVIASTSSSKGGHISRRPRVVFVDQDDDETEDTEPRVLRMTQEVKDMIDRYRKRLN